MQRPKTANIASSNNFRRVVTVDHYLEAHGRSHPALRRTALLGKERSGLRKHFTGNFRHDCWYALGTLVHNRVINGDLAAGRVTHNRS